MTNTPTPAAASDPPAMPGPTFRGIVSLLLFIHLFVVGLAIFSSSSSGTSQLLRDVKLAPPGVASYLAQFWLDHGYDYYLMTEMPTLTADAPGAPEEVATLTLDWDHYIEAKVYDAHHQELATIALPAAGVWPGERRQREQQMARFLAYYISRAESQTATEDETEFKSLLAGSIGRGLIRQTPGAESVELRCMVHRGISRREMASDNSKERDPNDARYFIPISDVIVVLDHDRPLVEEVPGVGEVSPLRKSPAKSSGSASSGATSAPANGEGGN